MNNNAVGIQLDLVANLLNNLKKLARVFKESHKQIV